MWLDATRVSTAPGKGVSRQTGSPVVTAARARVVGIPSAAIASLTMYSRRTGPSAARPSGSPPMFEGEDWSVMRNGHYIGRIYRTHDGRWLWAVSAFVG